MRYDVYGRFRIEVRREDGRWVAYRLGEGVRRLDPDVQLPAEIPPEDIAGALEDVFHEYAAPGRSIEELTGLRSSTEGERAHGTLRR